MGQPRTESPRGCSGKGPAGAWGIEGPDMTRFTLGVGQYAYSSHDGGTTWAQSLREMPARVTPIVRGQMDLFRLPPRPEGYYWDFVTVLPGGFGVAVDHGSKENGSRPAEVFVTQDGGRQWRQTASSRARSSGT